MKSIILMTDVYVYVCAGGCTVGVKIMRNKCELICSLGDSISPTQNLQICYLHERNYYGVPGEMYYFLH
ncbi:hypothetical protein [Ancylomarina euxinus]|uniref:hypothetical protein n=1 Tax=Ancylomarina euxinus TaxID=2283627 RepID=UPI000F624D4E|nr:hypothetical protein [Ancylomarina euxinus]MCZ4693241.1 hypothetical protein [Ancylomarina euxinus]MUP15377.1 hypothetical protein [Ancylomarina euxinus]